MVGETITCHNDGCDVVFVKKTHNQIYHEDECTRLATNAKIKEKYHIRRARHLGIARNCLVCSTLLSRYNPDKICNSCSMVRESNRNQSVVSMLSNIVVA